MEQSDPTPNKTPDSPSPTPSPRPSPLTNLTQQLPHYISQTDTAITHFNRLLSSTQGADTFLLTANYTLLTLLSTIEVYTRRRLRQTAAALAATTSPLLQQPGDVLLTTLPAPPGLQAATRLRRLTELISDVRVFVRLSGLLAIWAWASQTWRRPPGDRVVKALVWAQIGANVLYQALENGAYLARHRVLAWSERTRNRAALWSARFWALHVVLELARLWRVRSEAKKEKEKEEEEERWWRQVLVNAVYLPLTLHWSIPAAEDGTGGGGVMSEFWVGVLGSLAGFIGLRQLWRETEG